MKKTYKSSLLALSVLASFTSCSESESLQQANLSKDKITFHATLDNSWKPMSPASSSRAAIAAATEKGPIVVPTPFGKPLYLHPVVQDGIHIWSKEGKPITRSGAPLEDVEHERVAQTRGTMSTKTDLSDYQSFGVTAIYKEGENNVLLLDNAKAENTDGEFWGFTNNSNAKWPIGSTVSFHAYAPHSSADKSQLTYGVDKDNVQTQITYTASTTADDIINQPDLIVATNTGSRQLLDADDAVQLDFYHALTAVSFAIDKDLADVVGKDGKMTSVTLKGIPNKGNCNLSVSATANVPTAAWTMENGTGEYTFDLSGANIVVGEDKALTSDNQTLMMIPQTLPEGAELCFKLDMNGTTQEWKVPLKGQVWEAGKSIIYKLSSNSINMLDDAKIVYPDTWTAHSFPKTSFGENDVVGLYVVNKFNQIVAENVQLTKTKGENNTFTWKTKDNKNFSISTDNKYFFYYPYSSNQQNVNINADTAEDFFKDKIDNLEISSNQKSFEATQSADFQVGKGIFDASGMLTAQMKHQVGLAVLHMLGSQNGTVKFLKDSYKYFYGEKGARPVKGQDYYDFATVATYYPSLEFNDNIPYNNGLSAGNTYYSCYFVVPFGKTVKFKAEADPKVTQINNAWGKLQDISLAPTRENPIVKENVECDVPFQKIVHEYNTQKSVHVFETPEITEYQLECWGSKGQSKNGGVVANAGYSSGFWTATDIKQKLYICCGDMSGYNNGRSKGYNYDAGAWGGGGTHIATSLIGNGETYNYNGNRDQLLLVAGGSGGSAVNGKKSGAGGGNSGDAGAGANYLGSGKAKGGTQAAPGQNSAIDVDVRNNAQFGIGGYTYKYNPGYGSQGGGGYNGGGGGPSTIPGAGGCGFINTKLRNGVPQTGVNGPQATGVCRITWTYHRPATLK